MQGQRIHGQPCRSPGKGEKTADSNAPLLWCHACGDRVPRLDAEGRCELCQEIDARLEAHVGSVVADLTGRFLELALCYLHPEDIRETLDDLAPEMEPSAPRLRDVYEASHRFVEARDRRARERLAAREASEGRA
jgi:hypothetical protein